VNWRWDGEEEAYVVVRDVVQEEATGPAQEWSVNGGEGTTEEGPLLAAVVGHGGVRVVQVCEHDDPVVGQLLDRLKLRYPKYIFK